MANFFHKTKINDEFATGEVSVHLYQKRSESATFAAMLIWTVGPADNMSVVQSVVIVKLSLSDISEL